MNPCSIILRLHPTHICHLLKPNKVLEPYWALPFGSGFMFQFLASALPFPEGISSAIPNAGFPTEK